MSTARRIQLGILAVVVVVLVACGAGVALMVRADLIGAVDERLRAGETTLSGLDDTDLEAQLELLQAVSLQPDRESALLAFDEDDRLVVQVPSGEAGSDDPLPDVGRIGVDVLRERVGEPFDLRGVTGELEFRAISVDLGGAVLLIATPLDDVQEIVSRLLVALVAAAAAAALVIGVATSVVIRRAIDPIDDMIGVAAAIGAGDLSRRIDTSSHDREVRRLSGALNDMLHQLDDAFARKQASEDRLRRFVADASHELRTPLASIRGYAELHLAGMAPDADAVDRAMTRIRSEAVRTGVLVDELLLLARLDRRAERYVSEVDLTRVVADGVADARAVDPGSTVDLEVPADPLPVLGDEGQLRQVVSNLLANTRTHAPGARVGVRVAATDDGGVVLTVRDEGPGLDPQAAERAFDRFWRADGARARATGGSGLGLSIVASIVEAHGGRISLETAPGEGATFVVSLPGDRPVRSA